MAAAATGTLARLSNARRALSQAKDFHDVLAIRNEAEAVRQLLRVQSESLASQNEAAEVKIRAERLLGDSLAKMGKKKNQHASDTMSLAEIGIDRKQSSRWQQIAAVPEQQFEKHVAFAKESGDELTSAAVRRLANKPNSKSNPESWSLHDALEYLNEQMEDIETRWPSEFKEVLGRKLIAMGECIVEMSANQDEEAA